MFSFYPQSESWKKQKMRGLFYFPQLISRTVIFRCIRSALNFKALCLSSWGLVQPGILSVPELCHHLAEVWVSSSIFTSSMVEYKRQNPGNVRLTH